MRDSTRTLPRSLAPVVERLELDQPEFITLEELAAIAHENGLRTAPALIAHRLRERGWLLSTGLRGVWEFAPGSSAGPFSKGGPLLPLQAALALEPELDVAVALSSAAWAFGLSDRAPETLELAIPPGIYPPAGLARQTRICRFRGTLRPETLRGVPVQRAETTLIHMAARPNQVRSWGGVREWIGDLVAEARERDIHAELHGRPRSVRARLAYLLQGLWPALATQLRDDNVAKIWFGPRRNLRRHSEQWHIADTVLPFDPALLPPVR